MNRAFLCQKSKNSEISKNDFILSLINPSGRRYPHRNVDRTDRKSRCHIFLRKCNADRNFGDSCLHRPYKSQNRDLNYCRIEAHRDPHCNIHNTGELKRIGLYCSIRRTPPRRSNTKVSVTFAKFSTLRFVSFFSF